MNESKPNTLFVFPGQGSQYVGMGQDLCLEYPTARKIYEQAGEVLGYDIADLSFNGPEEQLNLTKFSILQQSTTAMLAQANLNSQSLLSLIGG